MIELVRKGSAEAKFNASGALRNLAVDADINGKLIVQAGDISALIIRAHAHRY